MEDGWGTASGLAPAAERASADEHESADERASVVEHESADQQAATADHGAPRWLELGALTAGAGLASTGVVGLLLAIVGRYDAWATLAVASVATAATAVVLARVLPARTSPRADHAAAVLVLVLTAGFALFAGLHPSQNVLVDRDPGSYTDTARSLARDGQLETDARGEAFAGVAGLSFASQAVYDVGPKDPTATTTEPSGRVEFQFNHLTSVVLATGYAAGGTTLMFRLPALAAALGLILVYAVAVRATRCPWAALGAPALLAVGAPFLYVGRNTYSEPFTLVLLWAGMLALTCLHRRPRIALAVVGGALLGATVCARIDAVLYVALAIPLAGISLAAAHGPAVATRARAWAAAVAAAAVPVAIGSFDLYRRSGTYVTDLADQLRLLYAGTIAMLVATTVGVAVWRRWPAFRAVATRWRVPLGITGALAVTTTLLAGWLVRPRVQTGRLDAPIALVAELQARDGLAVDAYASYAEDTLRWMGWYLGAPALLVAIATLGWVTYRSFRGAVAPAAIATLVLCLGAGGLYWWDPSITPDQLWATRRFVPAVFPALAVMAAIGVAVAARWAARFDRGRSLPVVQGGFLAAAGLLMVVPPGLVMVHVRDHGMQRGFTRPLAQACDALPDDAAVLVVGKEPGLILQQGVRSWCGVPTAAEARPLTSDEVTAMAAAVRANGHQLYVVGQDHDEVARRVRDAGSITASDPVTNGRNALGTLDRPPRAYGDPYTFRLFWAPAAPDR